MLICVLLIAEVLAYLPGKSRSRSEGVIYLRLRHRVLDRVDAGFLVRRFGAQGESGDAPDRGADRDSGALAGWARHA